MRISSRAVGWLFLCAFLILASVAFVVAPAKTGRVFAQEVKEPMRIGRTVPEKASEVAASDGESVEAYDQATKRKLAQRVEAEFQDVRLDDVLQFVADQFEIETFTQRKDLEEAGITLDAPVTLKLKRVRGEMLIELALRQVSPELAYVVRDGILIVATRSSLSDSQAVRVYNCRDLLGIHGPVGSPPGGAPPGSDGAAPGGLGPGSSGGGATAAGSGSMGSGMGGTFRGPPVTRGDQLQVVIRATVAPESWDANGGSGTMEEFGGLVVVNQSEAVHDRVEKLLQMLREAAAKK